MGKVKGAVRMDMIWIILKKNIKIERLADKNR